MDDQVVDHRMPLPIVDGFGLDVGDVGAALIPIVDGIGLGVGTIGAALTPPLPISTEPIGIPARETPPGDADDVTADDEALPLEVVPHVPDVDALPGNDPPVPAPIPPPSKFVLDPDIPDDGLPMAEHVVPLPVIPTVPVGAGLSPGDASSVAPMGTPVGATAEPGAVPSGEVVPMAGVGLPVASTCAKTGLHPKNAASIAAVNAHRIVISIVQTQRSSRLGNAEPADRQPSIADLLIRCLLDLADFVAGLPHSVERRTTSRSSLLLILVKPLSTCHRRRRPVEDRQMACRHH
jgi:hypothetical protein